MLISKISINSNNEFKQHLASSLLNDGELMLENEFNSNVSKNKAYYNSKLEALRISSDAGVIGYVNVPVENLSVGDKIVFSFESLSVSGSSPKISVDNPSDSLGFLKSDTTNYFSLSKGNAIVLYAGKGTVTFGLWTNDIGDFYIRNLEIEVHSKKQVKIGNDITKSLKTFTLNGGRGIEKNEIQVVNDYSRDFGKVSFTADDTALWIEYDRPFNVDGFGFYGIGFSQMSASSPIEYDVKVRSVEKGKIAIRVLRNNSFIKWSEVTSMSNFWFNVLVTGYDWSVRVFYIKFYKFKKIAID